MMLYRISTKKRAGDLSGTGAKIYGGRWNSPGNPVVYLAENISLAMLEILVHANRSDLRNEYSLSIIQVPEPSVFSEIKAENLPEAWRNFPANPSTIHTGDQWLKQEKSAVLKVPSAVNPYENNFLLNPLHKDSQNFSVREILALSFDYRFL